MGLIGDNESGYNRSSVFPSVGLLRDKKYFVLHGTQVTRPGVDFMKHFRPKFTDEKLEIRRLQVCEYWNFGLCDATM
jgi:hypothetical protein